MPIRKLLEASFLAAIVLLIAPPVARSEEPAATVVDDLAVEPSDEVVSSPLRSYVRLTAMSLLNRAGATATTQYGLASEEQAEAAATVARDKPYVILVHGFNSSPERCATLLKPIREAGFRCGTLRYPNDQSINDSAELLSRELKNLAKQHADAKVTLLTYSMGGLVARETVENAKLDPGNVTQLIMIAPPTHGSSCARIVCSGDIWEHGVRGNREGILNCVYACVEDGLGEARHELKPDSSFLKRLNARKRNDRVQYSIILGTAGPFSPSELALAKQTVRKSAESSSFVRAIKPALDKALNDLTDAVEEGDGVVSVARGKLDGVSDTVLLGFNHWSVVDRPEDENVATVHREILKRLEAKPAEQAVSAK
jgi:pimeloyl-ACP methyl ester carboxylesterase